jgi:epoxyqueuosine reductase
VKRVAITLANGTNKDWRTLKGEIIEAASSLGIDKVGFASADPFNELKHILLNHRAKGFESGFEEPDIDKRVHPEMSFDAPQSIISIAIAYPSKLTAPPRSEPGAYRGIISRSSWGEDYHHVLRDRLAKRTGSRMPEWKAWWIPAPW